MKLSALHDGAAVPKSSRTMTRFNVGISIRGLSYELAHKQMFCKKNDRVVEKKLLLDNLDLHVTAGSLVAIMGPSGSGKTTLLNVLSNHVSQTEGQISGYLKFDGVPSNTPVAAFSNYVMQRDILLDCLTVEETLCVAAELRLKRSTKQQRRERVLAVMTELGLLECRNVMIGGDFNKGISGGQKKRVAVAEQLLDDPSLIFLDEPTSGLDSSLAYDVVQLLKELSQTGRTVICTIHQPRSQIFSMFDQILLLSSGRVVYHGTTEAIVPYFASLGHPCPPMFNAADFVLDLISPKHSSTSASSFISLNVMSNEQDREPSLFARKKSPPWGKEPSREASLSAKGNFEHCDTTLLEDMPGYGEETAVGDDTTEVEMTERCVPPGDPSTAFDSKKMNGQGRVTITEAAIRDFPNKYLMSEHCAKLRELLDKQREFNVCEVGKDKARGRMKMGECMMCCRDWMLATRVITKRTLTNSIRHPMTGAVSLGVAIFIGLILGGVWFDAAGPDHVKDASREEVHRQVFNVAGALFFVLVDIPFSAFHCLGTFQTERMLYNRESSARLYTTSSFFVGKNIGDLGFQVIPQVVMCTIFYLMTSLSRTAEQYFCFLLIVLVHTFASTSYFYLCGSIVKNLELANLIAPTGLVVLMILSGFFIQDEGLPGWIAWLRWFSWIRYAFFACAANEWPSGDQYVAGVSNDVILNEWLGVTETRLWALVVPITLIGIGMRFMSYLALRFFNRRVGLEL
eukprot:GHVQ01005184.1.p1 GENE.GHVQ01005184.1~~GHVQ01005184.1.p1  ORF type:complete len:741 (-),score=75.98 GHVQ01005184.1:269-2491(-)